jgi:hypothetical protein
MRDSQFNVMQVNSWRAVVHRHHGRAGSQTIHQSRREGSVLHDAIIRTRTDANTALACPTSSI